MKPDEPHNTGTLTVLAMVAFAANSVLCRLALGPGLVDAATFTTVRMASGAVVLTLIMLPRWRRRRSGARPAVDGRAAAMLLAYMVLFSFAYLSLSAGTGALLLFGAVQVTMFATALRRGERFNSWSWTGLAVALAGLVYLVSPGVTAPDPLGAAMMVAAGVAWGVYSLLGRGTQDATEATTLNFIAALPAAVLVSLLFIGEFHLTWQGWWLAVASGAAASGLGYVVWYTALRHLTAGRAAAVQLSVPVIAALGGVVLLAEPVTARLITASLATLGGITLVLAQRDRVAAPVPPR